MHGGLQAAKSERPLFTDAERRDHRSVSVQGRVCVKVACPFTIRIVAAQANSEPSARNGFESRQNPMNTRRPRPATAPMLWEAVVAEDLGITEEVCSDIHWTPRPVMHFHFTCLELRDAVQTCIDLATLGRSQEAGVVLDPTVERKQRHSLSPLHAANTPVGFPSKR